MELFPLLPAAIGFAGGYQGIDGASLSPCGKDGAKSEQLEAGRHCPTTNIAKYASVQTKVLLHFAAIGTGSR